MSSILTKSIVAGVVSSMLTTEAIFQKRQLQTDVFEPYKGVFYTVYGVMCLYDLYDYCRDEIKTIDFRKDDKIEQKECRVHEINLIQYFGNCGAAIGIMQGSYEALFFFGGLEVLADAINWHPCVTYAYEINS